MLTRPLLALLGDSTHEVKAAIAKNIGVTLEQFQSASEDMRTKSNAELLPALVALESSCGHNWRMQLDLLQAFPAFAQVAMPTISLKDFASSTSHAFASTWYWLAWPCMKPCW